VFYKADHHVWVKGNISWHYSHQITKEFRSIWSSSKPSAALHNRNNSTVANKLHQHVGQFLLQAVGEQTKGHQTRHSGTSPILSSAQNLLTSVSQWSASPETILQSRDSKALPAFTFYKLQAQQLTLNLNFLHLLTSKELSMVGNRSPSQCKWANSIYGWSGRDSITQNISSSKLCVSLMSYFKGKYAPMGKALWVNEFNKKLFKKPKVFNLGQIK